MTHANPSRYANAAALAMALSAALPAGAATPGMPDMGAAARPTTDKCFGIARKGQNGCAAGAGANCAGTAKADYQGNVWMEVPAGTCLKTRSSTSPTGYGQLAPFQEKKS